MFNPLMWFTQLATDDAGQTIAVMDTSDGMITIHKKTSTGGYEIQEFEGGGVSQGFDVHDITVKERNNGGKYYATRFKDPSSHYHHNGGILATSVVKELQMRFNPVFGNKATGVNPRGHMALSGDGKTLAFSQVTTQRILIFRLDERDNQWKSLTSPVNTCLLYTSPSPRDS